MHLCVSDKGSESATGVFKQRLPLPLELGELRFLPLSP